MWTLVPELFGVAAAAAGLFRQLGEEGVLYRTQDFEGSSEGLTVLMWCILAQLAAHLSALGILLSQSPSDEDINNNRMGLSAIKTKTNTTLEQRCRTLRRVCTECSLMGSVFVQVLSGSRSMFDSYLGYMTGIVLVYIRLVHAWPGPRLHSINFSIEFHFYSSTYRSVECVFGSTLDKKTASSVPVSLITLGFAVVSCYAFYNAGAAPAIDPVAGLSEHVSEVASLSLTIGISFGFIGLAETYAAD